MFSPDSMAFRDTLPRKGRPSTLVGVDRLGFRVPGRVHVAPFRAGSNSAPTYVTAVAHARRLRESAAVGEVLLLAGDDLQQRRLAILGRFAGAP